ncbi:MAG TPA: ABC-F family ATP-binding cassette domain-containing protein [Blastocatellia bacterium]|nr:ABC-F family ATP-binding cassette domain-containing protein [Blastocatellia bacterium]
MLFRLEEVYKSYGAHEVLCGVTFQVNPAQRVGLVGRNGAGKTTIFRLLTGVEETDKGQVIFLKGLRVGVLEQQPSFAGNSTVREEALSVFTELRAMEDEIARLEHQMAETTGEELEEIMHSYSDLSHRYAMTGGFNYHARAESVLVGLGFKDDEMQKPADQLSGGQKARLALAKLLLAEPDVLLLDEPTNHLDVNAVEWLEDFLAEYRSAFVIISHDRFLLDRTTTKIVEIDAGRASVYTGNYSAYVRQREERRLAQARQYEQQQEMIARTEEFIRRNIAGQKTKQAKSRRNKLERLERIEAVRESRATDFGLKSVARAGDNVLAVADLVVGYDGVKVAGGISFLIRRGERVGIIGPNGSGKTTFLKTILGELDPIDGGLTWGANVNLAYFDQELAGLDLSSTVIDELRVVAPRATEGELRSYLGKFLFTGDEVFKPVVALSGGEKSRLALAKIIYSRANVLVLDEPTNHLDIPSREALEQALGEYPGTIITVSHDRYFLDRIATEILHFEDETATYHAGSYSDYYEERHRKQAEVAQAVVKRRAPSRPDKPHTGNSSKQRKRSAEDLEKEIHKLEEEMSSLSAQLSSPPPDWGPEQYAEIAARHDEISYRIETLYKEWEFAAANLE